MAKTHAPVLRFKGFSGEWEEKTLGDLGKVEMCRRIFKEQTQTSGDVPFFKIGTFGQEPDAFISQALFEEYRQKYPYPKKGDILISAAGTIGRTIQFTGENAYFQDSNIVWLRFDENKMTSTFLNVAYQNIKWDLEGSTIKRLYNSDLLSAEIHLPQLPEQTQIGDFFRQLDQQIAQARAVWEKNIQLKKAMLAKMFPVSGSTKPQIRFKGFSGDWERKKLGDLGDIITGNTPTTSDIDNYENDGLLWVTPTDIKDPITTRTAKNLSQKGKALARLLPPNSILVTCIASIGKNTLIETWGSCNQQINALIPKKELHPYFLLTLSEFWSNQMKRIAGSGTMDIVNKKQFSEIITKIPTYAEQIAIGNFFRQLDKTIALQSAEFSKLNQLKKGLLSAMLV